MPVSWMEKKDGGGGRLKVTYPLSALRPREPRMTSVGSNISICFFVKRKFCCKQEQPRLTASVIIYLGFFAVDDLDRDAHLQLRLPQKLDAGLGDVFDRTQPLALGPIAVARVGLTPCHESDELGRLLRPRDSRRKEETGVLLGWPNDSLAASVSRPMTACVSSMAAPPPPMGTLGKSPPPKPSALPVPVSSSTAYTAIRVSPSRSTVPIVHSSAYAASLLRSVATRYVRSLRCPSSDSCCILANSPRRIVRMARCDIVVSTGDLLIASRCARRMSLRSSLSESSGSTGRIPGR